MVYAYSENFVLPFSHDEVVHGKGSLLNKIPGDRWQQLATLRALYAFMWAHPGKQLIFQGSEFAQGGEWSESRSLDWWLLDSADHTGVQRAVTDLNTLYRDNRALWSQDTTPNGFGWIDANDALGNVFSFLRWGDDGSVLACVVNFSPCPTRTTGSACQARSVGGDPQHRRPVVRRFRRRQPGRGHGRRARLARSGDLGQHAGSTAGRDLVAAHAGPGVAGRRSTEPADTEA